MSRGLSTIHQDLSANNREEEGRQVFFKLGLAYAEKQEYQLAADIARRAFELSKTNQDRAAALIHEGLCRLKLHQLQEAEDTLVLAGQFSDDPGLVAFHRGEVQFVWRDYIEALDRFEEALEAGTDRVPKADICYQAALSHINLEEYPEARPYLEQAAEAGESAPICFYRGICELGQGRVESAMGHFQQALAMSPAAEDLGRVLFYIGNCYKELERYEEAIEQLIQAIEADPQDLANHNLLGFCYYKTKRHEEAVACFQRAVEIDPRSGIDWANLGSNLRDLGRFEEAIAMYQKALALDPSITFARQSLARLQKKP
jgi:tetratricopeptide (TPR) repeat protein